MSTEAEKIERIDMSEKEIENSLKDFFKKYDLVLKKKSERGFIWGNNEYDLNFVYGPERYYWFIFQGLKIGIGNKIYSFRDIINFMQEEREEESIDTYKALTPWSSYEKYMESHLIPFLDMKDNVEKIKNKYSIYR